MRMNIKNIVLAISLVFSTLGSSGIFAATQGLYLGAGIGYATITDSNGNSGFSSEGSGPAMQNLSLSLVGGYNLTSYLGIETSFSALGIFGWDEAAGGNVHALPTSIDIIGYLPLTRGVDIYGKVGSSNMRIDFTPASGQTPIDTETGKTKTFGYGIEFSISEMQSYRIGLEHFDLSVVPGTSVSTNYINITGLMHF